eukprot:3707349-Amphidinium_carterae.1
MSLKVKARESDMVAEQVMLKGLSRASINAVRLNVKDFPPQKLNGDSIAEPLLTAILKRTRQPITDADVIGGYSLESESERFTSLSKVILHRLLSMTEGESHALVQSLTRTACGYEAWRQLNIQYYG